MKRKVVFYYPKILTGGAEISLLNLISRLHEDADITVIYTSDESDKKILEKMSEYVSLENISGKTIEADTCVYCSVFEYPEDDTKVIASKYIQLVNNNLKDYGYTSFELPGEVSEVVCVSGSSKKQLKE